MQVQLKAAEEMLRIEQARTTQLSNTVTCPSSALIAAAAEDKLKSANEELDRLEKERDQLKRTIEDMKENSISEMEALESVHHKTTEELKKLLNEVRYVLIGKRLSWQRYLEAA